MGGFKVFQIIRFAIFLITGLVTGLIVGLIGWLLLRVLSKTKLSPLQFVLLVVIAMIGIPIYYWVHTFIHDVTNWALPWHYNYFSPVFAFIGGTIVCVIYYFLLFVYLFKTTRRSAIVIAIILGLITFPIFGVLLTLWIPILPYLPP